MTTECKQFDEKLLDYLYEELEEKEQAALKTHVDGCARCRDEVESFGRVRSAVKGVSMAEPPQAVSAKLLYQASKRAPRGVVVPLFRRVANHPMYAMAASFLVVGGIAGLLWNTTLHRDVAMQASPSAAAVAVEAPKPAEAPPAATDKVVDNLPVATPVAAAPVAPPPPPAPPTDDLAKRLTTREGEAKAGFLKDAPAKEMAGTKALAKAPGPWLVNKPADSQNGMDVKTLPEAFGSVEVAGKMKAHVSAKKSEADGRDSYADDGLASVGGAATSTGSSAAAPARGPIGQGAGYANNSPPSSMPPPIVAAAPMNSARAQQAALSDAEEQSRQVMEANMRAAQRTGVDEKLARRSQGTVAKSMPSPASPLQQAPAANGDYAARDESQPAAAERLVQLLDKQTAAKDWSSADDTFRQLQEHFAQALTPMARFNHARSQRLQGHLVDARAELEQLLINASTSLRKKIEAELHSLELDDERAMPRGAAAEAPMPSPAHASKRSAPRPSPSQKQAPAKADTVAAPAAF